MIQSQPVTNALSFDIEDWFHLHEIDALSDRDAWPTFPSLVVEYTEWILEALREAEVCATFFMLGWIAERHPDLSKLINDAGHELATHSYWHREVYALTPSPSMQIRAILCSPDRAVSGRGGSPPRAWTPEENQGGRLVNHDASRITRAWAWFSLAELADHQGGQRVAAGAPTVLQWCANGARAYKSNITRKLHFLPRAFRLW